MKKVRENKLSFIKKSVTELTSNKLKLIEGGTRSGHEETHSVYSRTCTGANNQDINLL